MDHEGAKCRPRRETNNDRSQLGSGDVLLRRDRQGFGSRLGTCRSADSIRHHSQGFVLRVASQPGLESLHPHRRACGSRTCALNIRGCKPPFTCPKSGLRLALVTEDLSRSHIGPLCHIISTPPHQSASERSVESNVKSQPQKRILVVRYLRYLRRSPYKCPFARDPYELQRGPATLVRLALLLSTYCIRYDGSVAVAVWNRIAGLGKLQE